MIADISAPDYETRLAILKAQAQQSNLEVDDAVAEYIVSHIQRNIRELEGALNRLSAFYHLHNKTPTIEEAKPLLKTVIQNPSKIAAPRKIIQTVA